MQVLETSMFVSSKRIVSQADNQLLMSIETTLSETHLHTYLLKGVLSKQLGGCCKRNGGRSMLDGITYLFIDLVFPVLGICEYGFWIHQI